MQQTSGFFDSAQLTKARGNKSMPESITVIIQFVEAIMEKYGFWKVTLIIILMIIAWKSPELVLALKT